MAADNKKQMVFSDAITALLVSNSQHPPVTSAQQPLMRFIRGGDSKCGS